jgi:hypothetical protein
MRTFPNSLGWATVAFATLLLAGLTGHGQDTVFGAVAGWQQQNTRCGASWHSGPTFPSANEANRAHPGRPAKPLDVVMIQAERPSDNLSLQTTTLECVLEKVAQPGEPFSIRQFGAADLNWRITARRLILCRMGGFVSDGWFQ